MELNNTQRDYQLPTTESTTAVSEVIEEKQIEEDQVDDASEETADENDEKDDEEVVDDEETEENADEDADGSTDETTEQVTEGTTEANASATPEYVDDRIPYPTGVSTFRFVAPNGKTYFLENDPWELFGKYDSCAIIPFRTITCLLLAVQNMRLS